VELRNQVAQLAGWLQPQLREPAGPGGDGASADAVDAPNPLAPVGLYGPASADWILGLHALGWLGAAVLPLPTGLPQAAWAHTLAAAQAQGVQQIWYTSGASPPPLPAGASLSLHALPAAQVLRALGGPAAPERFWPLEELRLIVLSSGTTGPRRPIGLHTGQLCFNAFGSAMRLGHLPTDRWLNCLPLHHVGGLSIAFRTLWAGTTQVLHTGFDVGAVNAALDSGQISQVSLVPQMLARLLEGRGGSPYPATLRVVLLGGAAASEALFAQARAARVPVACSWGMSETASQVATTQPGDWRQTADCGPPLAFARIDVGPHSGQLRVRGPVAAGGQIDSADRGDVDAAGRLQIGGRLDDLIISGGENISPEEVEAVLLQHPAVAAAAVVGRPDARWGQRPVAYLVARAPPLPASLAAPAPASPTAGVAASDAALQAHCRSQLPGFKVPDAFFWRADLPRTELGKLRRRALR
jgi:O-succinylbenzoic acid--CoA ligase